MIAQNASQHMLACRLSRRSMLVGLAGFTSLSALLAACSTGSGNPAGATATPTIANTSPTHLAQSPTMIPASGPIGATLYEYHGHTLGTFAVSWSPDGAFIASGGFDKTVRVWSTLTGETRLVYRGHTDQVNGVSWSPDSSRLAFAGTTGLMQSWEIPSGQHLITYPSQGLTVLQKQWLCLDWSRDGKYLAAGGYDGPIQIWNA